MTYCGYSMFHCVQMKEILGVGGGFVIEENNGFYDNHYRD